MKRWLRRNAVALVAIAVLAPTTIAVTFHSEWNSFLSTRATQPLEAAQGHAVRYADTEWRVRGSERIAGGSREGIDAGLPAGSDLLIVTIDVDPGNLAEGDESRFCMVRLAEYSGSGNDPSRSWTDAMFSPIDYRVPEGTETGCSPDIHVPYTFTSTFVIAGDAGDSLGLHLEVAEELPRYLLLRL